MDDDLEEIIKSELKYLSHIYDGNPETLLYCANRALTLLTHLQSDFDLISNDFGSAVEIFRTWKKKSLDDAFGVKRRKHQDSEQFFAEYGFNIFITFWNLLGKPDEFGGIETLDSIADALAEEYAEFKFSSASFMKKTYYRYKKGLEEQEVEIERLNELLRSKN